MAGMVKTVTEQIYNEIRNAIMTQEIPAGEKLTVKMLHEMYGVSSSPIREALTMLKEDGLIEYKPNVGMSVIVMTAKDVDEIFDLMAEMDVIAMSFSFKNGHGNELIRAMKENLEKLASYPANDKADDDEWIRLSDNFHLLMYDYADNSRLTIAARKIRAQMTVFSNAYERIEENKSDIAEEHGKILAALENNDLEGAGEIMREHLMSSKARALQVFQSSDQTELKVGSN